MLSHRLSFQCRRYVNPQYLTTWLTVIYRKGNPGLCTATEGILSYSEIEEIVTDSSRGATVTLDSKAAVKIAVFDDNQWVGYDDAETLRLKQEFANSVCIGG